MHKQAHAVPNPTHISQTSEPAIQLTHLLDHSTNKHTKQQKRETESEKGKAHQPKCKKEKCWTQRKKKVISYEIGSNHGLLFSRLSLYATPLLLYALFRCNTRRVMNVVFLILTTTSVSLRRSWFGWKKNRRCNWHRSLCAHG